MPTDKVAKTEAFNGERVTFARSGPIAIITINHPPVNALSAEVVQELIKAFDRFEADADALGLIIECAGRTFIAGGDLRYFDDPNYTSRYLSDLLKRIENSSRPVACALFGTVLGGGLELAMACHYRAAHPTTRLGLPEIRIGLIPGCLGTQRLPRLCGLRTAYQMISTGEAVRAVDARIRGLVDLLADDPNTAARSAVFELAASKKPLCRTCDLIPDDLAQTERVISEAQSAADRAPFLPARAAIARCIEAAALFPFDEGDRIEQEAFAPLPSSPQSRALRHLFFAEREATRVPGATARPNPIEKIGILGAGIVADGMEDLFARAGRSIVRVRDEDVTPLISCHLFVEALETARPIPTEILNRTLPADTPILLATKFRDAETLEAFGRTQKILGITLHDRNSDGHMIELQRCNATSIETLTSVLELFRQNIAVAIVSHGRSGSVVSRMRLVLDHAREKLRNNGLSETDINSSANTLPGQADRSIFEQLYYPSINEAARLLAELAVYRSSDIDLLCTLGCGFPSWLGGPVHLADTIGLDAVVRALTRDHVAGRLTAPITPLLLDYAAKRASLSEWKWSPTG